MATLDEKIQKLEEKLKQEKAKKARLEATRKAIQTKKTREKDLKKKILLGSFLMEKSERAHEISVNGVRFSDWLTRNADRELFGFALITEEREGSHTPKTE